MDDWDRRIVSGLNVKSFQNENFSWKITHDESHVYVAVQKLNSQTWNFPYESFEIGIDTLSGLFHTRAY